MSKRFHPVSSFGLPRAHFPRFHPVSVPLQTAALTLAKSSLPLARFRIRIGNETSNYHQRLPSLGGSPSQTLSLLSPSFAHFFLPFDICNQQPETASAGSSSFSLPDVRWNETTPSELVCLSSLLPLFLRLSFFLFFFFFFLSGTKVEVEKVSHVNCN